ncbi:MAG: sensor histidine kinase [Myxococcaceae bacterium]|nr:sensor histidine kinase [Myxococcaceae bacterium]
MQERFVARARALFYARMMFLGLGLLIFTVPAWRMYFGTGNLIAFAAYTLMLLYSVANYMVIDHRTAGRYVTYVTLCFDLVIWVGLLSQPQTGGGLQSPLLATQLVFTTLFALLFPRPVAIIPPLLVLPITIRLDQLLNRAPTAIELLTLLWYLSLNFILIYVLVYLNEREVAAHREVVELQSDLKELAVVEERNRLAREIHDGLGASLSSLIIQSEYLTQLTKDPALLKEIGELKTSAEESIEELRRNLRMMREDFDLGSGLEDYVKTFRDRTQVKVVYERAGYADQVPPETQLTFFRVLQESLSNAARHAASTQIVVKLSLSPKVITLSVKDDGKGFDPQAKNPGHYGLINLRERALKVQGEVIIDSKPGAGTHITFQVPLRK